MQSESLSGEKVLEQNGFAKSSVTLVNLKMLNMYKTGNNILSLK